jgi:homotetrameric cytidine deaminase
MDRENTEIDSIFEIAKSTRENAYAPYSGFKVGAAARLHGTGTIIGACNVENVSYGATVCAERNVVFAAVAQTGAADLEDLVIVTDAHPPAVPCALCLQVLQEFCSPDLRIHLADLSGVRSEVRLRELLPQPFSSFP